MHARHFSILSLMLVVLSTGCAGVKNSMRVSEKDSVWNPVEQLVAEKTKDQADDAKPVSMAVLWADSVLEKPGSRSVKGFGGRFFFYDPDNNPVKADGELIVYGFDDSIKDKDNSVADKKFVFRSTEFQQHYSESALGGSYSVWIPWEEAGGIRKSITLIPMFRTTDGNLLRCGQSINVLPGKTPEKQVSDASNNRHYEVLGSSPAVVSQTGYESPNGVAGALHNVTSASFESDSATQSRINTSTFKMTPALSQRLATARNARTSNATDRSAVAEPSLLTAQVAPNQTVAAEPMAKDAAATPKRASTSQFSPILGQQESVRQNNSTTNTKSAAFGQPAPFGR